jgi:peptide-methionine (R)-S-oxide reductase
MNQLNMNRRNFLFGTAGFGLAGAWGLSHINSGGNRAFASIDGNPQLAVDNWQALLSADDSLPDLNTPLNVTESEWASRLNEDAFRVLFEEATERAGSSALNHEKRDGIYACKACSLPLFSSAMKYDSGTGWPSFFTAIDKHLATSKDYKMLIPRTEYHCARCGGHQGHVFSDGPAPTGQRWCNNGVALEFFEYG